MNGRNTISIKMITNRAALIILCLIAPSTIDGNASQPKTRPVKVNYDASTYVVFVPANWQSVPDTEVPDGFIYSFKISRQKEYPSLLLTTVRYKPGQKCDSKCAAEQDYQDRTSDGGKINLAVWDVSKTTKAVVLDSVEDSVFVRMAYLDCGESVAVIALLSASLKEQQALKNVMLDVLKSYKAF